MKPYITLIDDIPPKGLTIDEILPHDFVAEIVPPRSGLHAEGEGHAALEVKREGERIDVKGEAEMQTRGECTACLESIAPKIRTRFSQSLFRVLPGGDEEPVEEPGDGLPSLPSLAEDNGSGEYDGKQIHWGEIVKEQLLLAMPIAARCKEDCLGLCPHCGKNRNHEDCDCAAKQIDPRWEKLRLVKPADKS